MKSKLELLDAIRPTTRLYKSEIQDLVRILSHQPSLMLELIVESMNGKFTITPEYIESKILEK